MRAASVVLPTLAIVACAVLLPASGLAADTARSDASAENANVQPVATPRNYLNPALPEEKKVELPKLITAGVSVGGTLVGGLTRGEARAMIAARFDRPFTLQVGSNLRLRLRPSEIGASADIGKALRTATTVRRQGFLVPLSVSLAPRRIDGLLDDIARRIARKPRDARLVLRNLEPTVIPAKHGQHLDRKTAARAIRNAVLTQTRDDIELPVIPEPPKVADDAFETAIVIRRGSNRLTLYVGEKPKRTFSIATGRSQYPTPIGRFEIVNKQRSPWWYPPASEWARDLDPVPPGPGNPLGTRWMGISSPSVGIHGTPDPASIGYSASHGCVRMLIPEVEWLFERVGVGTPVFIVSA